MMKSQSWTIFLLSCLLYPQPVISKKVTYYGDQVLKITPKTPTQSLYLQALTRQWRLDLWKPDSVEDIYMDREIHVQVPSTYVQHMKENLDQQKVPFKIMIEDVQKLIDNSLASRSRTKAISLEIYDYDVYHPMDEIYEWMEQIKDKHSDVVSHHLLGNTYEERTIGYFKVGLPSIKTKKVIVMDCGIHAREWISVAYCQWFVKEILAKYKSDALLNKLLKQVDFYIVPVLNVDGYIYSWTKDRLWRKNRSPQNGTCFGVDLNRNFDVKWGELGASTNCLDITFCGPSAASELETKGLVHLVEQHKPNILMYLSMHSYAQLILLPYGYTMQPSENHDEMDKVAKEAAAKLKLVHDTTYYVGPSSHILYSTSGTSGDWAADIGIKFAYTYELRDEGDYGFELPADQIQPTCEETFASMLSMFEYIDKQYLGPLDDDDKDDDDKDDDDKDDDDDGGGNGAVAITSLWINMLLSFAVCIYCALIN